MSITAEQLKPAFEAFVAALPEGAMVKIISTVPRAGVEDTDAGVVSAILLAENDEDMKRFEQVLNKGIAAYREEPGLVAHFLRKEPTEG